MKYLGLIAVSLCTASFAAERPNILFFFADDQRADTIHALGNPVVKTPNLDKLAKRGLAFDRAYMQGGQNAATCIPSRAMLLSGQNLFSIDERLLRDECWPEAYGKAGYTTFISGKWHQSPASLLRNFKIARSIFVGGMTDPLKAKLSTVHEGVLQPAQRAEKHACEVFADEAVRFIKEHKEGSFFCYVPFDAPHDPHIVPAGFKPVTRAEEITLPKNFLKQHPWDNGEMLIRDERLLPWPRSEEAVKTMIAEYYTYITHLDAQIGRVMDALESSPFAKNTIVVFAADSGVARGSHGLIGKQNCYEHSMCVPLIIAGPGIVGDKRTEALCYLFDVLPTLGALCGVTAPPKSQGKVFSDVLKEPTRSFRSEILLAYKQTQRAWMDSQWKLIRYPVINKTQLFDLKNDPLETQDLAEEPSQQSRVAALSENMKKAMALSGDTAPFTAEKTIPALWSPPNAGGARNPRSQKAE
jgi:arylsulfatase A-like enzyme